MVEHVAHVCDPVDTGRFAIHASGLGRTEDEMVARIGAAADACEAVEAANFCLSGARWVMVLHQAISRVWAPEN